VSKYPKKSWFSVSMRTRLRQLRFEWLKTQVNELEDGYSVFELGCFNCRSLNYLPKPKSYVGADAGWEGGLNDAQMTYVRKHWVELVMSRSAHDLSNYSSRSFEYCIALETLEHIPDAILRGYLEFMATRTQKKLLVTVPVEFGLVFLVRFLLRLLFNGFGDNEISRYNAKEVYWAIRGQTEKIGRYEHKGFDYRRLITLLAEYYDIEKVEGIPLKHFPTLCPQVGIVAKPELSAAG